MSERHGYEPGVPCWIDTGQPDPRAAADFYTRLFGWQAENTMPPDAEVEYLVCRLRGRAVAAISGQPPGAAPRVAAWSTHVWVDSADDVAAKVAEAGGRVVAEPFDVFDAGRMAVLSDPTGASFSAWQPGTHRGAQLVNEPGAWSMSALNTRDPEGAKAFYGAVFGWAPETFAVGDAEITMFRVSGYVGGEPEQPVSREVVATMAPMSRGGFPDDVPPHWRVDFWVDDVDATAALTAELGGDVVAPPYDLPGVGLRQAVLADPRGATFSVTRVPGG
ncbi:MAG: VOC family protein [Solirubrobacterales bacterium]|nr:VOC family protein [Solirubrobacterales bacterium]